MKTQLLCTFAHRSDLNIIIDHIVIGSGVYLTGTDSDGWGDLVDYCTDHTNRAWGMIQYDDAEGVIYSMGKIYIGSGDQAAATPLTDEGRIIQFIHNNYYSGSVWTPLIPSDYHEIIIEDDPSYITTWEDGIIVGNDRGRNGSLIIGDSGAINLRIQTSGQHQDSRVKWYGTTFKYAEGGITGMDNTGYEAFSVTFDNCGQFEPSGAMKIRECIFSNTLDDSGALLWHDDIDILGGNFIANDYGIQHDQTGTVTYSGMQFSANTYDLFLTTSTGLLTVNATDSNVGTAYSGANTEVDIVNSVTLYVKATDSDTVPISGAIVRMSKQSDGSEPSKGIPICPE